MLTVIFEFEPVADRRQDYLDFAAALGTELENIDGFISIERFESLTQPGKLLSISFWRESLQKSYLIHRAEKSPEYENEDKNAFRLCKNRDIFYAKSLSLDPLIFMALIFR